MGLYVIYVTMHVIYVTIDYMFTVGTIYRAFGGTEHVVGRGRLDRVARAFPAASEKVALYVLWGARCRWVCG